MVKNLTSTMFLALCFVAGSLSFFHAEAKATKPQKGAALQKAAKPVLRKKSVSKRKTGVWKGYVAGKNTPRKFGMVLQHPLVASGPFSKVVQGYLTVVKHGKWQKQVIALFKKGTMPKDTSKPVEITGTYRRIGAARKSSSSKKKRRRRRRVRGKRSYRGTVVTVISWKYLSKEP